MRGRKQDNRSVGRRHRRCLLAGLLAVSAQVAMADSPIATAPLPLIVPSAPSAGQMQVNPFCQPVPAAPGVLAELESDTFGTPVLHGAAETRWSGRAVVNGAYPHPADRFDGDEQPLGDGRGVQQSSGRDPNMAAAPADDGMRSLIQESTQVISGGVRSNPLVAMAPTPVSDVAGVKSLVIAADHSAPSGPISFSFSDDDTAPLDTTPTPPSSGAPAVVSGSEPAQFPEFRQKPHARPRTPWNGSNNQTSDRPNLPSPTLARPTSTGRTLIVPLEGDSGPGAVQAVGRAQLPQPKSQAIANARLINGSRPKVEVGRPPLAIERDGKRTLVVAEAPTSSDAKPSAAAKASGATPDSTQVTQLRFKPTDVRALKVEHTIQKVDVQSAAVCAVVKTGSNQLQLIATGDGVTKLTLWTVDQAGKLHTDFYEIHVAAAERAQVDDPHSMAATLTHSVNSAFPKSRVLVRYNGGRFEATGICSDEDSARRVLRMVRSACQMPVDDKVVVR